MSRTVETLQNHVKDQIKQLFNEQSQIWLLAGNKHQRAHQAYLEQINNCDDMAQFSVLLADWEKLLRGYASRSNRPLASLINTLRRLLNDSIGATSHEDLAAAVEQAIEQITHLRGFHHHSFFQRFLRITNNMQHDPAIHYCLHVLNVLKQNIVNHEFFDQRGYHLSKPETVPADEPVSPLNFGQPRIPAEKLFLKNPAIVYVSGGSHNFGPNGPGHSLLYLGTNEAGIGGYVHTNSLYGHIEFMDDEQFKAYLEQYGKVVVGLQFVDVPFKQFALEKLHELCNKKWWWGVVKHNCLDFAKKILQAGGADLSRINQFLSVPTFSFQSVDTVQQNKGLFDTIAPGQVLKSTLVENIPLSYHSNPADAKKVIDYVCANMSKVLTWQNKLRLEQNPQADKAAINETSTLEILKYLERKILNTKWKFASNTIDIYHNNRLHRQHNVRGYMNDMLSRIAEERMKDKPDWPKALDDVASIGLRQYHRKKAWYHRFTTGENEQYFLKCIKHTFLHNYSEQELRRSAEYDVTVQEFKIGL